MKLLTHTKGGSMAQKRQRYNGHRIIFGSLSINRNIPSEWDRDVSSMVKRANKSLRRSLRIAVEGDKDLRSRKSMRALVLKKQEEA